MELTSIESRFWQKVDKDGPLHPYDATLGRCWIWTASKTRLGYGMIRVARGKTASVHRVSYALAYGPLADNVVIRHSCDLRSCVNPTHLVPGSQRDNVADREARGRHPHPRKTHCPQGHPYDADNTGTNRDGTIWCRECNRVKSRAAYLRRKGGAPSN